MFDSNQSSKVKAVESASGASLTLIHLILAHAANQTQESECFLQNVSYGAVENSKENKQAKINNKNEIDIMNFFKIMKIFAKNDVIFCFFHSSDILTRLGNVRTYS